MPDLDVGEPSIDDFQPGAPGNIPTEGISEKTSQDRTTSSFSIDIDKLFAPEFSLE